MILQKNILLELQSGRLASLIFSGSDIAPLAHPRNRVREEGWVSSYQAASYHINDTMRVANKYTQQC